MPRRLHVLALQVYGRLPRRLRRTLVGWAAPSYTVGTICVLTRDDGRLLLVRHSYRDRWGFPGGLLDRGEEASAGACRESLEEVGLAVATVGAPTVVVAPRPRRVDVVFRGRVVGGTDPDAASPCSPEIVETRWFRRDALPELQFEAAGGLAALESLEGRQDQEG